MNNDLKISRQHAQALEELQTTIQERGWKESVEFITAEIAGRLSIRVEPAILLIERRQSCRFRS